VKRGNQNVFEKSRKTTVHEPIDKTALIAWLVNSNANFLTIQNVYVFAEFCFSFETFLRGDWSSHKNYMGEDHTSVRGRILTLFCYHFYFSNILDIRVDFWVSFRLLWFTPFHRDFPRNRGISDNTYFSPFS
jgi:hypothetical protein